MKTYELLVTTKELSKWDSKEGQGDFVKIIELNKSIKFKTNQLAMSDIANALKTVLGFGIDIFDLSFENDELAYFDVIETEKGFKCEKGSLLAEYDFKIKLNDSELNLEEMFG